MTENEAPKEPTGGEPTPQEPSTSYPPFLEFLETKEGHELASRVLALFEGLQRATIEAGVEQKKREIEFQHRITRLWLWLQTGAIVAILLCAAALAWHGKLDATVATLMATLFGYFLGRPIR